MDPRRPILRIPGRNHGEPVLPTEGAELGVGARVRFRISHLRAMKPNDRHHFANREGEIMEFRVVPVVSKGGLTASKRQALVRFEGDFGGRKILLDVQALELAPTSAEAKEAADRNARALADGRARQEAKEKRRAERDAKATAGHHPALVIGSKETDTGATEVLLPITHHRIGHGSHAAGHVAVDLARGELSPVEPKIAIDVEEGNSQVEAERALILGSGDRD